MFPPETTHTSGPCRGSFAMFPRAPIAKPEPSAAASGVAPAPSATTCARVVAEGAGGAAVAAALRHKVEGKVVCVVSGGNIDAAKLAIILDGRIPT